MAIPNATIGLVVEAIGLGLSKGVVAVMEVRILGNSSSDRRITKLNWRNSFQRLSHIRRSLETHPRHQNIRKLHILALLLGFFRLLFAHFGV